MIGWIVGGIAALLGTGIALNEVDKRKLHIGDRANVPASACNLLTGGLTVPQIPLGAVEVTVLVTELVNGMAKGSVTHGTIPGGTAIPLGNMVQFPITAVRNFHRGSLTFPGGK